MTIPASSVIPRVAGYLFDTCTADPTLAAMSPAVTVIYGDWAEGADYPQLSLWILAGDPDGTPPVTGATATQKWSGTGNRRRDEDGVVHCYAEAWTGENDTRGMVEAAFGVVAVVENITRLDPSAGNTTNGFTSPGVNNLEVRYGQTKLGTVARVHFEFGYFARLGA